jgi:hypothetical protein
MTDDALKAASEDAVARAKIEKFISVIQVPNRTLLVEGQKELGIRQTLAFAPGMQSPIA